MATQLTLQLCNSNSNSEYIITFNKKDFHGIDRFDIKEADGISMNQFIASAVAEKIAAFETKEYLEERAKKARRTKFKRAMAKVAAVKPDEQDELES
jgi:hypothetical protein